MNIHLAHGDRARTGFLAEAVAFVLLCAGIAGSDAQQLPEPVTWKAWQFLIGEWIGEGGGSPGQGTGGFTFLLDLQNTILVRKNFARYPAQSDKPAYNHDDLMMIYYEKDTLKAMYFDNERHIIHYTIAFAEDSSSVAFLSDPVPSTPRYKLTYTKRGEGKVGIMFEIAQPDKPDDFSPYIEATARKK